jgi:6-phosphofructokinase 1
VKKIGILTGGGDCGGLNGVIKGAALMAVNQGLKSYIIPHGYAGLYNLLDFDTIPELTEHRIDQIDANLARSDAGHSRVRVNSITNPAKYNRIKTGLQKFGIDGLVISGGDDTGSVMVDLAGHDIPCVHAPKTMDLDLQSYSVGFDSTVNRIAAFLEDLKTTGETHNRIIIMEVFGRYAEHTAFRSAAAADADAALIPEIPTNFDVVFAHCKTRYFDRISHSDTKSGTYLVVVAEGFERRERAGTGGRILRARCLWTPTPRRRRHLRRATIDKTVQRRS